MRLPGLGYATLDLGRKTAFAADAGVHGVVHGFQEALGTSIVPR